MKTIIAGSRDITDLDLVKQAAEDCGWKITQVVSGGTRGVDHLGETYAKCKNIPIVRYDAQWNLHGKSAGMIRNCEMARYADALIALHDDESNDTKHIIDEAHKRKLFIYIVKVTKDELSSID